MMADKPPIRIRHLLDDIAELRCGLRDIGLPREAVERVTVRYIAARLGGAARTRSPAPPPVECDWREGRWVPIPERTT